MVSYLYARRFERLAALIENRPEYLGPEYVHRSIDVGPDIGGIPRSILELPEYSIGPDGDAGNSVV